MNVMNSFIPDLLQRFVPTPYVFAFGEPRNVIRIESNDLELARGVLLACKLRHDSEPVVLYWKIIRDWLAPQDGDDVSILLDNPIRTVLVGSGTILSFDQDKREVLGFLSPSASVDQLVNTWIPLLIDMPNENMSTVMRASLPLEADPLSALQLTNM